MKKFHITEAMEMRLVQITRNPLIETLARRAGLMVRKARKVKPGDLLLGWIKGVITGRTSYAAIADTVAQTTGETVSKQDIQQRTSSALIRFLMSVLGSLLTPEDGQRVTTAVPSFFHRMIVLDSTHVPFPSNLAPFYPSGRNQTKKSFATAKIQAVYDLLHEQFVRFFISPYTESDSRLGWSMIADVIESGDLIMWDLGYFALATFRHIAEQGAYFLSRLKPNCTLIDPEDPSKTLSLLEMLQNQATTVDRPVLLGKRDRLPVRLVAVPVTPEVAEARREKAAHNRDRRYKPSSTYLALLGWNIYIVNVPSSVLAPTQIEALYRLRWRIEILFKIWKSEFHLRLVPSQPLSLYQAQALLLVTLIVVTLFHQVMIPLAVETTVPENPFPPSGSSGGAPNPPLNRLSLVKLTRLCKNTLLAIITQLQCTWMETNYLMQSYQYEHRTDRDNYCQRLCTALS